MDAQKYAEKRYATPDQRHVHQKESQAVLKLLKELRFRDVLDVPCGYGRFTRLFLDLGAQVVCADLSREMLEVARKRLFPFKPAPLVVADIRALPFDQGSFDLVFCMRLLQHMEKSEDRMAALAEMARVTRRWVLVSFYRTNPWHRLVRGLRGMESRITMIPEDTFREEARAARLRVVRLIKPLGFYHAQTLALLGKPLP